MSRNNYSEQTLAPTTAMDSNQTGRHDSLHHSPKQTFKERSTKTASKRSVKSGAKKPGGRGAEEMSAEEDEGADEDDSSAEQDDDDDDVEEPEVFAPSDRSEELENALTTEKDLSLHRAGHVNGNETANTSKKRTFSDTKNTSVLSETEDTSDARSAVYPRKKTQRRLSNNHGLLTYDDELPASGRALEAAIDLSDDEGYGAVDLISDSDDDEVTMEKLEENAIVESELDDSTTPRRKAVESDDDSDFGDMDLGMDPSTMGTSFFAEQMDQMPADQTLLLLQYGSPSPQPSAVTRKVHFADVVHEGPSSSETSSDTAELPDIFLETSMSMPMVPMVQNTPRGDEYDSFNSNSNSEDGSYWDWRDEDATQSTPTMRGPQSMAMGFDPLPTEADADDESGASSGYESDSSGDTTEDDMPPPPKVTTPKAILRSHRPPTRRPVFRHAGRPSRSLPILGQFTLDRSKAVAYRHKSMGIVVHPPRDPNHELARFFPRSDTSSAQSSPQMPFQSFNPEDSDFSDMSRNPFSGPLDVMFSGMFGGASNQTYNFGGQVIGPPEAFYPFRSVDSSGSVFDLEDGSYDEDDDDYEDQMDIHDFIQFGVSDGDDDEDDVGMHYAETTGAEESEAFSATSPAPTDASSAMTPFRSNSIAGSELMLTPAPSQSMLDHLDRGFVTSFRNNQDRAKRLSKLPHDSGERASTSRPIRSGYDANSVITPLRKRKLSRDSAVDMKMSGGGGAFHSKIGKKEMRPPRRPKLPPRGFF